MHFLFRLDLSLHTSAEFFFGILIFETKHGVTRVFFPHPFLFFLSLAAQRFRICPARVPSLISNDWWSGVPSECSLTAMVNA